MESNRYFVVMLLENITETFVTESEYKEFLNKYNKANKDEKNPRVLGNLKTIHKSSDNNWIIKYALYQKVTKKYPLSQIDNVISNNFEDENELRKKYKNEIGNRKGKIYIGYMYNGGVRTIDVAYKADKVYVNYEELSKLILSNILTPAFLANIWSDKLLNSPEYRKNIPYHLEKIQEAYGKYVMSMSDGTKEIESAVNDFVKVWCSKEGKLNQLRIRELGKIVKKNLTNRKVIKDVSPIITELQSPKVLEKEKEIRLF